MIIPIGIHNRVLTTGEEIMSFLPYRIKPIACLELVEKKKSAFNIYIEDDQQGNDEYDLSLDMVGQDDPHYHKQQNITLTGIYGILIKGLLLKGQTDKRDVSSKIQSPLGYLAWEYKILCSWIKF